METATCKSLTFTFYNTTLIVFFVRVGLAVEVEAVEVEAVGVACCRGRVPVR